VIKIVKCEFGFYETRPKNFFLASKRQ